VSELVDLVGIKTDRVKQLIRGALPDPDGARAEAQGGERFNQGDLGRFRDV